MDALNKFSHTVVSFAINDDDENYHGTVIRVSKEYVKTFEVKDFLLDREKKTDLLFRLKYYELLTSFQPNSNFNLAFTFPSFLGKTKLNLW